jgi:hypothetical protein
MGKSTLFPELYDIISDIIKGASSKHTPHKPGAVLVFLSQEPGTMINAQQIMKDFLEGLFRILKRF